MATSSVATPPAESFTMLPDTDLEAIGAHCHYTYCNQLDFLPFRCESCKFTYCLDHRTETSHVCPKAGAWAAAKRAQNQSTSMIPLSEKPTLRNAKQCSHPQCKTFINTSTSIGIACQTCNRSYCLKHRMKEDHSCSTLTPIGARPTPAEGSPNPAQKALARLKAWGKSKAEAASASSSKKVSSSNTSRQASALIALNKLKSSAKGDSKIPIEKRIYLQVEAESSTTTAKIPSGSFFYNKEWSVGRLLDDAAKSLQVENVNNRGGGEETRLRVYHVEGGRLLEFGEKIGMGVQNGNTLVLLRGVGPAVPDLVVQE